MFALLMLSLAWAWFILCLLTQFICKHGSLTWTFLFALFASYYDNTVTRKLESNDRPWHTACKPNSLFGMGGIRKTEEWAIQIVVILPFPSTVGGLALLGRQVSVALTEGGVVHTTVRGRLRGSQRALTASCGRVPRQIMGCSSEDVSSEWQSRNLGTVGGAIPTVCNTSST